MPGRLEEALQIAKDPQRTLGVTIGEKKIKPGDFIPKADTHSVPKPAVSGTNEGKHIAVCIDLDAPFAMFPFLSPICHWLQTDLDRDLAATTPPVIPYHGAGPPPIARASHRYVFVLFKQPEGFEKQSLRCAKPEGEPYPMPWRMRFDFEGMAKKAGLGGIVAANYFTAL